MWDELIHSEGEEEGEEEEEEEQKEEEEVGKSHAVRRSMR